jgi:hypothetical protein
MLCRISENHEARKRTQMWYLTLDLVDGFGKTSDVLAGDTSNRDTAVLGSIHGVLLQSVKSHVEDVLDH